jgi:hypothetical protein
MYKLIEIPNISDNRGNLNSIEFLPKIGFAPKRIFVIQNVPAGGMRGDHAHKECIQVLHCLQGSISVELESNRCSERIILDNPGKLLYVPAKTWLKLFFVDKFTILSVYASDEYKESDYIRDYEEFSQVQ